MLPYSQSQTNHVVLKLLTYLYILKTFRKEITYVKRPHTYVMVYTCLTSDTQYTLHIILYNICVIITCKL